MTTIRDVEDFLALRRSAMVGVSRNPEDFSRKLFREMCERGYDMVPVNLVADEIEGRECFQCLQVVQPPVESALVMTPFCETIRVVQDCKDAGVRRVWMYRAGVRGGAVSQDAIASARSVASRWWRGIARSCSCPARHFRTDTSLCPIRGVSPRLSARSSSSYHNL